MISTVLPKSPTGKKQSGKRRERHSHDLDTKAKPDRDTFVCARKIGNGREKQNSKNDVTTFSVASGAATKLEHPLASWETKKKVDGFVPRLHTHARIQQTEWRPSFLGSSPLGLNVWPNAIRPERKSDSL